MSNSQYSSTVLLLFVACSSITTGESLYHTFWVTPSTKQVCGNRTPCDTIDGYYNQAKDIFSTSNATWIFLNGPHRKLGELEISMAKNIIIKGLEGNCYLQLAYIKIQNSSNISIQNMDIKTTSLIIVNISGFLMKDSSIKKFSSSAFLSIFFGFPTGLYYMKNCTLDVDKIIIDHYMIIKELNNAYYHVFHAIFEDTLFLLETSITYHSISHSAKELRNSSISIKRSCISAMNFLINIYFQGNFHLSVTDSQILGDFNLTLHNYNIPKHFQTVVDIHKCHFNVGESPDGILFSVTLMTEITTTKSDHVTGYLVPKIKVSDTKFEGTALLLRNLMPSSPESRQNYLIFHNCTFEHYQRIIKEHCKDLHVATGSYVLVLHNLHFPVLMSDCKIIDNKAGAIFMSNSKLQFHGYNLITRNEREPDQFNKLIILNGMVVLHCSTLLLESGSQLSINHNQLLYPYGSIAIPPTLIADGYSLFVKDRGYYAQCYSNQRTIIGSDGRCFFQLVDEKGQFPAGCNVTNNGIIKLFNNTFKSMKQRTGSKLRKEMYNGHLFNCKLQTQENFITMNMELLKKIIHRPPWTLSAKNMKKFLPYQICLCNRHDQKNISLWDCSENSNMAVNLLERDLLLYISIIDDFGEISNDRTVEFICNNGISCNQVDINQECKIAPISNIPIQVNSTTVRLRLMFFQSVILAPARLLTDDRFYSVHTINILKCPIGFEADLNTMKCECLRFLIDYHIECQSRQLGFTYKQVKFDSQWIGIEQQNLVLCNYCPLAFCNELIGTDGVTLDDYEMSFNNEQCNEENGRIGFVCSECPSGYSSVFGGYTCTQCNGPWFILFIPLHVLAGLALVALLFLFNLTIVQGTINGISLYANIMYLYHDDLQDYAGKPLYKIILLLNFGSEFEICLYDGMNEFTKAMLLFSFPFYLLLIVVLIIIGAHKFNLRIFKIEFIAKRAVPVLATLMVLTYTNLIGLVIHALRYTNIYTHNTLTEEETTYRVWLYQPRLRYFEKEHLALGLLAVTVIVLYLIPLTVVTLFGDLLRRNCIRSLWFSHFLDVFHGAYRWPLGFWLGLRLLLRLLLVIVSAFQKSYTYLLVFLFACLLFYMELHLIKPFHGRFQSKTSLPNNTSKNRIRNVLKWFLSPVNVDGIFLMNIIFFSGVYALVSNKERQLQGSQIAISVIATVLGAIQVGLIIVAHGWMFFPIPKCLKERLLGVKALFPRRKKINEGTQEMYLKAENYNQTFPFYDIHHLKAGLPQENESSDEDETSLSQSGGGSAIASECGHHHDD